MPSTTIKVPSELRDRLNAEARREHTTVAGVLEKLLAERERADRFQAVHRAIAMTDAADLRSYAEEIEAWERADSDTAAS